MKADRPLAGTIDLTVEQGRFREIFHGTNLKRTLIVVGVNVFLQLTGQNFTSVYGKLLSSSYCQIERKKQSLAPARLLILHFTYAYMIC